MIPFFFKKESFTPVYLDSEEYVKQNVSPSEQSKVNTFAPAEPPRNGIFQAGYNNPYVSQKTETSKLK
jgi:hypothetical protein